MCNSCAPCGKIPFFNRKGHEENKPTVATEIQTEGVDFAFEFLIIPVLLLVLVPVSAMFLQIVYRCWAVVSVFLVTAVSLWAQDEAAAPPAEKTPDWVLPYALMMLFLALTLLILLRPLNRSDSAFSYDELKEQKEEELKKLKGTH